MRRNRTAHYVYETPISISVIKFMSEAWSVNGYRLEGNSQQCQFLFFFFEPSLQTVTGDPSSLLYKV
jgi:hypothetical protein